MNLPDESATSLGSGMRDVRRTGSIGLRLPLVPTRAAAGEPAIFIPDRWTAEIVRVGSLALTRPRSLPSHELVVGGRLVRGVLLHVPKGRSIVLGRDPHPKDEREADEDQICVRLLRVGAPPERVSSAVVSFVRLSMEGMDSVYAVNGHYSKGRKRNAPQLNTFVEDETGLLVKHLNGPHVSKELAPGMELVLGYKLEGVDIPRTYRDNNERLLYVEGLAEQDPAWLLDDLTAAAHLGDRQACLAISSADAGRLEISAPQGERPVLSLGRVETTRAPVPALVFAVAALASRIGRRGSYELLVGSDRDALRALAEQRDAYADLLVVSHAGLSPVHLALHFLPDGLIEVEPLLAARTAALIGAACEPRQIPGREPLPDGSLLQLGASFRTKLFNRNLAAQASPPRASAPAPSLRSAHPPVAASSLQERTVIAGGTPSPSLMRPERSWLQRLTGFFAGR